MGQIAATVETIDLSAGETLVRIVAATHHWLVCRIMGTIVQDGLRFKVTLSVRIYFKLRYSL